MKKKSMFIAVLLLIAFAVTAGDITGKEVALKGELRELTGMAKIVDDELCIDDETGLFQIHLGPEWYMETIGFEQKEGILITVKGYFITGHISPQTVEIEKIEYRFRNEYGKPMWSGYGNSENEHEDSDCDTDTAETDTEV